METLEGLLSFASANQDDGEKENTASALNEDVKRRA